MLLITPLFIMLIFIIIFAYWKYDNYAELRKRFKGYRNVLPERFEMKKQNFYGQKHNFYGKNITKNFLWSI